MKLVKCLLLALTVMLSASVAHAQLHLGIKAGANLTKIDGKPFNDEFKFNYLVGAFAELGVGKKFSINPELLFNQSTATVSDDYNDVSNVFKTDQRKAKLNYLSIPILLDYKLIGPLHIQAGPQFSAATSKDKSLFENSKNAFKGGDFALVAGAQLNLMKFRGSVRYVAGMQDINDAGNQEKWKNRAIQVAIGYAIF